MSSDKREDEVNEFPLNKSSLPPLAWNMFKALNLLKESFECKEEFLAQVWAPFKLGDQLVLSTHDQPFLVSTHFCGYRHESTKFTFSIDTKDICRLGLPGRVFTSGLPEWTSDIFFYKKKEYLRADDALDHQVCGSIAIPIFEGHDMTCRAVLEIVTRAPKQNFDAEMEIVGRAFKAMNLTTNVPAPFITRHYGVREIVLAEITKVLPIACCAHKLPLALTWTPCRPLTNSTRAGILCLETKACYVNDEKLRGFVQACSQSRLREGQGAAGTTFKTHQPSLYGDVKRLNICSYPVVHHARKFGLRAAATIWTGSSFTRYNDYITEFFLPPDLKEDQEQISLVRNLSVTIQNLFNNFRQQDLCGGQGPAQMKKHVSAKNVCLSNLLQRFPGTLKTAAKSTGVCPRTLKRICRRQCLLRCPSRKISKATHSLKKLQTLLESVEGMERELKICHRPGDFQPLCPTVISPVSSAESTNVPERSNSENDSKIIIIATYRDDTIGFKFDPKEGCSQLYKDVGTIFKLHNGTLQLQYLDDDDDWKIRILICKSVLTI